MVSINFKLQNFFDMEDQSPVLLHLSFYAIGISAWVVTTAVFGEGAYLVGVLPEEDKLFAAVDLAMELGNLPTFLLVFLFPAFLTRYRATLCGALVIGAFVACVFLAICWKVTLAGASVALLAGSFAAGCVGSASM